MYRKFVSVLFAIGFLFLNIGQLSGDGCVFYTQAHPDDWQLFRGEQVWKDISDSSKKVVFIYTTSGDAGQTNGWWQAREAGAMASVKVVRPDDKITEDTKMANNHPIQTYTCGNTISYFMRIPEAANNPNLSQLYGKPIVPCGRCANGNSEEQSQPLETLDRSTTYENWNDFVTTLNAIMETESQGYDDRFINVSDNEWCRVDLNCTDHPDHHYTSLAVQEAANYPTTLYVTYNIANKDPNLGSEDYQNKQNIYFDGYVNTIREEYCNNHPESVDCQECCEKEWGINPDGSLDGNRWGAKSYWRLRAQ